MMKDKLSVMVMAVCALCLFTAGLALAQNNNWIDEITNSLAFYKTTYPTTNFDPYVQKLDLVKNALAQGDQRTVRVEMSKWFKMLRNRDHGINDVAADELLNFAAMVAPIQEYGISVPPPPGGSQ